MPEPQAPFLAGEQRIGGLRCSEVLHVLSDYVDGELPPAIRAQVEAHVAACENCARFGASFQRMLSNSLTAAAITGDLAVTGDLADSLSRTQKALQQRLAAPPRRKD